MAGSAIRLSFQPVRTEPHQTKQARPRRASLGIFNTAGYEVLMALFLASQIPFSISLSSPSSGLSFLFTLSLFLPSKLPVPLSQFPFLLPCRTAPLCCLFLSILNLSAPVQLFYSLALSLWISRCMSQERARFTRGIFSALAPTHPEAAFHLPFSGCFYPKLLTVC